MIYVKILSIYNGTRSGSQYNGSIYIPVLCGADSSCASQYVNTGTLSDSKSVSMLPPKYTKTVTVTSQDAGVTITATYAAVGVRSGSLD